MNATPLHGLIAATYTPFHDDGRLNPDAIPEMTSHLIEQGVTGLYVCGSTGEGMSLTSSERRTVAERFVAAADGRVPVIVQAGHNSLAEARQLAAHAQECGAGIVSATCPSYYTVNDVNTLVDCMAELAGGAPDTPFYYYHIPALTGSTIDMVEFLQLAGERIPNLAGLKYTDTRLHEFQECSACGNRRYEVVWGCDEMLLGALATGARGAIGSTYNIAAPLYRRLIAAHASGQLEEAQRLQSLSVTMIRTIGRYPFHAAMKAVLGMQGFNVGGCRLPQGRLSTAAISSLKDSLNSTGFFEWSQEPAN